MKKPIYPIIALILLIPSITLALTLEEYANNLDTSFYDGTINITFFSDRIVDTDSNSQNDALISGSPNSVIINS